MSGFEQATTPMQQSAQDANVDGAADSIRWALDQLHEPAPKIWVARCEACNSQWTVDGEHSPNPKGTFCPDCRSYGLTSRGILNWEPG